VEKYIVEVMKKNGRVIFNGNNYAESWLKEAEKRGLPNIRSAVAAIETMTAKDTVDIFVKYNVMSKREVLSRHDIYLEQYVKQINIEARTSISMVKTLFLPAGIRYTTELAKSINTVKKAEGTATVQESILAEVSGLLSSIHKKLATLEKNLEKAHHAEGLIKHARAFRDLVFVGQKDLRKDVDALEQLVPADLWPVPTYAEMLFKL